LADNRCGTMAPKRRAAAKPKAVAKAKSKPIVLAQGLSGPAILQDSPSVSVKKQCRNTTDRSRFWKKIGDMAGVTEKQAMSVAKVLGPEIVDETIKFGEFTFGNTVKFKLVRRAATPSKLMPNGTWSCPVPSEDKIKLLPLSSMKGQLGYWNRQRLLCNKQSGLVDGCECPMEPENQGAPEHAFAMRLGPGGVAALRGDSDSD
jgi:hypothetical protein